MKERKTWEEFAKSGLLWFINTSLHVFGWAIVIDRDKQTGHIVDVYPAKVGWRGFTTESNTRGYERVTQHLHENIHELVGDIHRTNDKK